MADDSDLAGWTFTPLAVRRTDAAVSQQVSVAWSGRELAAFEVLAKPEWLSFEGPLAIGPACTVIVDPGLLPATGPITGEVIIDLVDPPEPAPQTLTAAVTVLADGTPYDRIEDAIRAALVAEDSPFRPDRVLTYGCQLSPAELGEAIERLKGAAPAAMVYYAGGKSNENTGQVCDETAEFHVVVVASSTGAQQVLRGQQGLYPLLGLVRSRCNFARVPNPLTWVGNRRLPAEWAVTSAAMQVVFTTLLWHND